MEVAFFTLSALTAVCPCSDAAPANGRWTRLEGSRIFSPATGDAELIPHSRPLPFVGWLPVAH
jgi:hypothetical protein